jgi:hypothetical protein
MNPEYCFDLMDGVCERDDKDCWFNHNLPPVESTEYKEAMKRKQQYLDKKAARTIYNFKRANPKEYEHLPPLPSVIDLPTSYLPIWGKIEDFPGGWPEEESSENMEEVD